MNQDCLIQNNVYNNNRVECNSDFDEKAIIFKLSTIFDKYSGQDSNFSIHIDYRAPLPPISVLLVTLSQAHTLKTTLIGGGRGGRWKIL